jgi:16S rRNA G966 N2-methylase RsmD
MTGEIVVYQSASDIMQALPELGDQYDYYSKADVLRRYFKDPNLSRAWLEAQAAMAETIRQKRENGELAKHGGDRTEQVSNLKTCLDMASKAAQSNARRWSEIAAVPEAERCRYYATVKMPSRRGLLTHWQRKTQRPHESPDDCDIHNVDFRELEIADESVALIFTDPPYERKSADLYRDLAEMAARVLIPGGSLLAYSGQVVLPTILSTMSEHLRFWWLCGCYHSGAPTRMTELGIINRWKPIIWMVKGTRRDRATFVEDEVTGGREKDFHDWQQAESEAAYFIDLLTIEREMVFDPFVGSGTTCIAARKLGRNWIGCDIDEDAVQNARAGVHGQSEKASV